MKFQFSLFSCFCIFMFLNCQIKPTQNETNPNAPALEVQKKPLPQILQQGLDAHGGLERWQQMNTLQFSIMKNEKKETHLTNLKNRHTRITHEDYTIGFDGKEVWVSPDKAAFGKGSARFYHNLRFYFVGLPFLLADPGIIYEELPQTTIHGVTYNVVKISYEAGVGDAPKDYYIAHFNTTTHLMDWLLYTVTYYDGKPNEDYGALYYEWQEVNGLKLPKIMRGYKYEQGVMGEMRYETPLIELDLVETTPDEALFVMPEVAEIDSLIKLE